MHFIIKFEISLLTVLNVLGFLLFTSEKKSGGYTFLICYFLVINIYCFFDYHVHGSCSWNISDDLFKFLRFLKGCLNAILQFLPHLQENLEKHTNTHQAVFLWKNMGKAFS